MKRAASRDRRHRIADALRDGGIPDEIARRFDVTIGHVTRIRRAEGLPGTYENPAPRPYVPDAPALSIDPMGKGYDAAKAGMPRTPSSRWQGEDRDLWLMGYDEAKAELVPA